MILLHSRTLIYILVPTYMCSHMFHFKYISNWDIFHIVLKWFILYIQSHCDTFSLLLSKYFLQAILQSQTIFIVSMEVRLVFNAVLQYLFAFALEYFSYGNGGAADVLTRKQRCMFRWCILETKREHIMISALIINSPYLHFSFTTS